MEAANDGPSLTKSPPARDLNCRLKRLLRDADVRDRNSLRSEEHTSELQSLMRISYAVFCLKKKNPQTIRHTYHQQPAHVSQAVTAQKTLPHLVSHIHYIHTETHIVATH